MKKEVLFAVVIGSILGLIVAFGIWRANASFDPVEEIVSQVRPGSPSPSPTAANTDNNLSITKPEYNEVVLEGTTAVSGITKPNSYVSIYLDEVYLIQADPTGTFSIDVDLAEGINHILVKTFDTANNAHEQILRIVYDPNLTPTEQADESKVASDSVREKIQQKLEQVSNKPQAAIGTVTDKTSSGFNIRNGGAEIKQITIQENQTLIIKSGQTDKTIPFSDLAIGDFVAAIGYKTSAGALEADQVLIDNTKPLDNYELFIANVAEVTRTNITINPLAGVEDDEIVFRNSSAIGYYQLADNKISTIKSTAISENDKVVVLAKRGTNTLTVEDVYIVESTAPSPTPAR